MADKDVTTQEVADHSTTGSPEEASISEASIKFIGQWRGLVSTTNWEKGKIIAEWRQDLIDSEAPASEYSDEVWSQLVGDVTPQHVGRLRRVHERFGESWPSYEGLYWTHFLAALDWEDCELWLEGALQNHWSVSQMRRKRWETLGSVKDDEPLESQIVAEEDSDVDPLMDDGDLFIEDLANVAPLPPGSETAEKSQKSKSPGKESGTSVKSSASDSGNAPIATPAGMSVEPLESLDELPDEFVDAFEDFRHVILDYKKSGWEDVSQEEVLQSLESLRMLVVQ